MFRFSPLSSSGCLRLIRSPPSGLPSDFFLIDHHVELRDGKDLHTSFRIGNWTDIGGVTVERRQRLRLIVSRGSGLCRSADSQILGRFHLERVTIGLRITVRIGNWTDIREIMAVRRNRGRPTRRRLYRPFRRCNLGSLESTGSTETPRVLQISDKTGNWTEISGAPVARPLRRRPSRRRVYRPFRR